MFVEEIQTHQPDFHMSQVETLEWLAKAWSQKQGRPYEDTLKLFRRVGCRENQISQRYYYLPEFHQDGHREIIDLPSHQGHLKRNHFFQKTTEKIFHNLYQDKTAPDHLIHVTCTGYTSPSAAQKIASEKFSGKTEVFHAYHMGCYAAIPALKLAMGMMTNSKKENCIVDIVHTELCTLHIDLYEESLEQMVIQSLFADGAVRYRISKLLPNTHGLLLIDTFERILPNTQDAMFWVAADHGMKMGLSKDVPTLIGQNIKTFMQEWSKEQNLPTIDKKSIFAIHPGGPKIIDAIKEALQLEESQVSFSRAVLYEYGNMSSATLPFIWKKISENKEVASGTDIYSLAFGPGLTMAAARLKKT